MDKYKRIITMTTYAPGKEAKVQVLGTISFKDLLIGKSTNHKNLPFLQKFINEKAGFKFRNNVIAEMLVGMGYVSFGQVSRRKNHLYVITASKEPKNLKLDGLQPNDLVKIVKIPLNFGEQIRAAIEVKNIGETKTETFALLDVGTTLIYKGYSPQHSDHHLFLLPNISCNVEIFAGDFDLMQCEFVKF